MNFKQNENLTDRLVRAVLAVILLALGYYQLAGLQQIVAYLAGVVLLVTAITGFCGLYTMLGINTNK